MYFNFITHLKTCSDFVAYSNPVTLVLYSHIPSALVALLVGGLVLVKNKTLLGRILFGITICFTLWVVIDLVSWLSTNSIATTFTWSFFAMLTALISILTFYFFYVFLFKKDLSIINKIIIFSPLIPILVLTPTTWNILRFDMITCEAVDNINFISYYYFIGVLAAIGILFLAIFGWKKNKQVLKKEVVLMTFGLESFLLLFLSLGYMSSYIDNYNFEFYGLFGMIIFMIFLAYMIVKFKSFNIKIISTQFLVWALVILIGSEFLFVQSDTNKILTAITLIISAWLGLIIVRSVKREIASKEALRIANIKLQELDQLKSEFVSLATHQIRSPLSAIKGYLSEVFEGDFGPLPAELEKPLRIVFQSTENLVHIVGDFLNISRIEQGKMKYEIASFDMKSVVEEVVKELKPNIDRAGLTIKFEAVDSNYFVLADVGKVKQVIGNLVDNSLKYTPKGGMELSLVVKSAEKGAKKVLFKISDTGIGIPAEVIPKLFQKFTRAEGANEVNIIGTGLGLYVAKLMIEGQGGRIWAESEGKDKGSQFYVELPVGEVVQAVGEQKK